MRMIYARWAYRTLLAALVLGAPLVILVALIAMPFGPRMREQPRLRPFEDSEFFDDHRSARHPPEHTIARGQRVDEPEFYWGRSGAPAVGEKLQLLPLQAKASQQSEAVKAQPTYVEQIPVEVDTALLARGQQRFDIYCAPCHGRAADGKGIIPRHGFPSPPSLHATRLREAPAGYFFNVITLGYGMMFSYGDRVSPQDRWAIVAYIRALQLSQRAPVEFLNAEDHQNLNGAGQ